jgi:hypothetical protein
MKHLDKKYTQKVMNLKKDGFTIQFHKNKFTIFRGKGPSYIAHSGLNSYHPIRRFLKNNYNYIFK